MLRRVRRSDRSPVRRGTACGLAPFEYHTGPFSPTGFAVR